MKEMYLLTPSPLLDIGSQEIGCEEIIGVGEGIIGTGAGDEYEGI